MNLFIFRTKLLTRAASRDKEGRILKSGWATCFSSRRSVVWHPRTTIYDPDVHGYQKEPTMKPSSAPVKQLFSCCLLFIISWGLVAAPAVAQEFRGSVTGRVIDPSGASVPGAQVTVTNTGTNVSHSVTTNEQGVYTVLYLADGRYNVIAEKAGFKKLLQTIEVRVGDKIALDLPLEVGSVTESVNITTEQPLETNSATAGQVIDRRRISELPLSDGNPFTLVRLAPGI